MAHGAVTRRAALLAAQRAHRVDSRGANRRDDGGGERDRGEERRDRDERQRIVRADAEEKRSETVRARRRRRRRSRAQAASSPRRHGARAPPGAEGWRRAPAVPRFARSTRHRVRDHAVDANRREPDRDRRQHTQHEQREARVGGRVAPPSRRAGAGRGWGIRPQARARSRRRGLPPRSDRSRAPRGCSARRPAPHASSTPVAVPARADSSTARARPPRRRRPITADRPNAPRADVGRRRARQARVGARGVRRQSPPADCCRRG